VSWAAVVLEESQDSDEPDDDGGWWWDELEMEQAEPRVKFLIQLPHLRSDLPSGAIEILAQQGDE
jgi:hypothetical protein